MKKIIHFMILKKGWLLLLVAAFAAAFFAFRSINTDTVPITQKQKLLAAIGQLLAEEHYSPKDINDAFAKQVFKKYIDDLDFYRGLFLQEDIVALKKFETSIDEEIKGTSDIGFVPAVSKIFSKRAPEAMAIYKNILSKPFDFSTDETIMVDVDKVSYAANQNEREILWHKRAKFLTLEKLLELQDQREKSKIDSISKRTDAELEIEARAKVLKSLDKTFEKIKVKFTEDELFNMYINVITNLMDPHTDYFPPIEKRAFDEQMSNRFYGIGAQLQEQDGVIKIASLVPGMPAFKSGEFTVNDVILKVGQGGSTEMVDITGYDITDAVKLIRGNKGTEVKLDIKKIDGTIKNITLVRDEIVQDELAAKSVIVKQDGKKIGFISLPDFYANFEDAKGARCSRDVAMEIAKLKDEKVDGIVIDLRNNGGGSLYEVIRMVGFFIKTGPVVQVKDREGKIEVMEDRDPNVLYDGPLAVMVNELSASASEIFAAAIQDYKRGIVIGSSSTYGKGTVQRNIPLGKPLDFISGRTEYGAVKLTFQKFYRVNGGSTQLKGVTPDIVLPDPLEYYKIREKDNTSALPWDEIKKANYDTYTGYNSNIATENESIKNNPNLGLIRNNINWLSKTAEAPVSLQINKYKEQQKLIRSTANQINTLSKLSTKMQMELLPSDSTKYYNNPDKLKGDRYKNWLDFQKTDFYIDETVKIVAKMVGSTNPIVKQ